MDRKLYQMSMLIRLLINDNKESINTRIRKIFELFEE